MVLFVAVVGDDFWVRLFGLFIVFLVDIFRGYFGVMYIFQIYIWGKLCEEYVEDIVDI